MKTCNSKSVFKIIMPIVLIISISSSLSCGNEKQKTEKTSSPSVNAEYSTSLFDEVKMKALKNPNDTEALYHLADLYDRNAQYTEALDTYKKILALKPDYGYIYFKIGTTYDRVNQPAEAVASFNKAAKFLPNHAVLYNNMGVAYGKLGKFDEEVTALKKALKIRPRYTAARYNLGITYLKKKNKKAAMQEYESLKKFDEGAAESLLKEIKGNSKS